MLLMVPIYALLAAWLKRLVPVLVVAIFLALAETPFRLIEYERQAVELNIAPRTYGQVLMIVATLHVVFALLGWGPWRLWDRRKVGSSKSGSPENEK